MSNVWTESEYLMKKNDRNHEKKILDNFPSGGGLFNAKNVRKIKNQKKANILETIEKFSALTTYSRKLIKFLKLKKNSSKSDKRFVF